MDFVFKTEKNSVLDFSHFLDAPAGKYGFLRSGKNGVFEFEKRPEVPVRFWGTNLCFTLNFMPNEETDRMLDDLVSMGYNTIRPHHFDCGTNGREPNEAAWKRFDYLLAAAKKRGL